MKKQTIYYFLTSLFLIPLLSCDKELEIQDQYFPLIVMEGIDNSSEEVTFKAQLVSSGKNEIKEYGFIYTDEKEINIKVLCGTGRPPKEIRYKVSDGIYKGADYVVQAYLVTTSDSVFSDQMTFVSKKTGNRMELTDFEPKSGHMNQEVTVSGKNLRLDVSLKVYIGEYEAKIIERTESSVKIRVPETWTKQSGFVKLINRYDSIQSESMFDIRYAWTQKRDFNIASLNPSDCSFNFVLGGKAYLYFTYQSKLVVYDPEKDEWNPDGPELPHSMKRIPAALTVGNQAFVLLQDNLYSYSLKNGWEFLANCLPYQGEYHRQYMSYMNGKLYIMLTDSRDLVEIREFDLSTKEIKILPNPGYPRVIQGTAFFSHNNKLYLLSLGRYGDTFKIFFEYDFSSWRRIDNLPELVDSEETAYVSYFKKDDLLYFGLGRQSDNWPSYATRRFWSYNPVKDEWKRLDDCIKEMYAVTTFLIGDKAYMLSPGHGNLNASWVFEFDTTQ